MRPSARGQVSGSGSAQSKYALIEVVLGIIIIALIVAICVLLFQRCSSAKGAEDEQGSIDSSNSTNSALTSDNDPAKENSPSKKLTVTFAGDCTLGTDPTFDVSTSFNAAYEDAADPSYFLEEVRSVFENDDLTIVNMEGTFTDSTDQQDKTFTFKGDPEYAEVFTSSSVEAASVANNHSYDYGQEGYDDTLVALDGAGIETFGYDKVARMTINDIEVALIGVNSLSDDGSLEQELEDMIHSAKDGGAELVLVYAHWGIERETVPNEQQMTLARAAIDAGADLVVGSHPHVIQGWEIYNGRYIVYSLGNFCFGGNSNPSDMDCMMFQQTFTVQDGETEKNEDAELIACSISSSTYYNDYRPRIAEGAEKERIDQKIQESSDAIAANAPNVSLSSTFTSIKEAIANI